ncbi:hypothetical protein HHI36_006377 [Cryptolaemus montrouzieri]|uniref:Uncharacterized protein n=1 Tax=Cryptolaemus montrouzieri TaxID=559131 RepID=A0ABD2NXA3_9CUCU
MFYYICAVYSLDKIDSAKILNYDFKKNVNGPYNYRFSTSDGFTREETAELLHEGTEFESIFLRGSYQYQGADGKVYTIKYRADDNGFHPEGDHIEVPPFVPWPSKIDVKYIDDNSDTPKPTDEILKASNTKKPLSEETFKFLTTQRPPKFSGSLQGDSSIFRKSSTSKPARPSNIIKLMPASTLGPKFTKQNKNRKPFDTKTGGVSTSRPSVNPEFIGIPKITKEYIPLSTIAPKTKGDIIASSTAINNTIKAFQPKSKETFSPFNFRSSNSDIPRVTTKYLPSSSERPNIKYDDSFAAGPTVTYEGEPSDSATRSEESNVILFSTPETKYLSKNNRRPIFGTRISKRNSVQNLNENIRLPNPSNSRRQRQRHSLRKS